MLISDIAHGDPEGQSTNLQVAARTENNWYRRTSKGVSRTEVVLLLVIILQ